MFEPTWEFITLVIAIIVKGVQIPFRRFNDPRREYERRRKAKLESGRDE